MRIHGVAYVRVYIYIYIYIYVYTRIYVLIFDVLRNSRRSCARLFVVFLERLNQLGRDDLRRKARPRRLVSRQVGFFFESRFGRTWPPIGSSRTPSSGSSTETATFRGVAKMDVTNRRHTGATLTDDALLNQLSQAEVLIDVTVAPAMLVLRVAPLMTFPPLVVGRRAKQHGFRRGRTDPIARDVAARSCLVESTLTEETGQGDAELLVDREVTIQQTNLSALALVSVYGRSTILFLVRLRLIDRTTVRLLSPLVVATLYGLTPTLMIRLVGTPGTCIRCLLLANRLRQ